MVKNPPAMQETWVLSLGREDALKEGMETHSSILGWRITLDRGARRLWGHKKSDMTDQLSTVQFSSFQSLSHIRPFVTP